MNTSPRKCMAQDPTILSQQMYGHWGYFSAHYHYKSIPGSERMCQTTPNLLPLSMTPMVYYWLVFRRNHAESSVACWILIPLAELVLMTSLLIRGFKKSARDRFINYLITYMYICFRGNTYSSLPVSSFPSSDSLDGPADRLRPGV